MKASIMMEKVKQLQAKYNSAVSIEVEFTTWKGLTFNLYMSNINYSYMSEDYTTEAQLMNRIEELLNAPYVQTVNEDG